MAGETTSKVEEVWTSLPSIIAGMVYVVALSAPLIAPSTALLIMVATGTSVLSWLFVAIVEDVVCCVAGLRPAIEGPETRWPNIHNSLKGGEGLHVLN